MTCGGCSGAIDRVLKKKVEARESPSYALCAFDGVHMGGGRLSERERRREMVNRGDTMSLCQRLQVMSRMMGTYTTLAQHNRTPTDP